MRGLGEGGGRCVVYPGGRTDLRCGEGEILTFMAGCLSLSLIASVELERTS